VLDTFLPDNPESAVVRLILLKAAPGDWRKADRFDIFIPPGFTLDMVFEFLETFFINCVAGCAPYIFPRSRWTGADRTCKQVGILLSIHDILRPAFLDWHETWHSADLDLDNVAISADAQALMIEDAPSAGPAASAEGAETSKKDFKQLLMEANRAHRKTARGMLLQPPCSPLKELLALRWSLGPWIAYRMAEFATNSYEGESKRWAGVIKDGTPNVQSFFQGGRKWPLLDAATGRLDRRFFNQLRKLPGDLSAVPDNWKTLRYNHLIFRLLTRAGCCLELLRARPHRTRCVCF